MPYQGQAERILSGSLNLLQPGSEIADHDAQKLENFSYDANGNLRSRKGHTAICSASSVNQLLKSLGARWQAVEDASIVGYQKYLWKVGAGQALKNCGSVIGTGGPRKSRGSDDLRWIPKAPATKPTTKAADTVSLLISDFAEGWVVDPAGADSIHTDTDEAGDPIEGSDHLQIQAGGDETYSAMLDVSLDLATGHHIDDVHKITLWCKQWKKIEGVSFECDCNNGDFATDCYVTKMDLLNRIIGKRDEAVFYIRKRPFGVDRAAEDKKRYGHFNRIGSTPDKDWRSIVKLRIKVDFSDGTKFRFIKWELIGDEDNVLEGDDFRVYQTFTTADSHESNPGPASDPLTVNRNGIEVSDLAVSDDPQVTGSNIYLSGGTLGLIYRVNGSGEELVDEGGNPVDPTGGFTVAGTSYSIIQGEDDITALGIEMENDHDDPPDGAVVVGPYYDRLLIAQSGDHPERIWWSKQAKPYAFPGANQAIGNFNDVGNTGEKIMAITLRPHTALIYKENSVWVLMGDPGDLTGDFHNTNAQMGISSPNGVVNAGPVDYAHMSEGIYVFNGATPTKISQKIDPIFKGRTITLSDGTTADPVTDVTDTALGFRDNVLWFSYTSAGGRRTLKLDIETARWFSDTRGFTAFYYEGQNGTFIGALSSGSVVSLETGLTDSGSAIHLDYLSKDYDMGRPDMDKKFEDFTIETLPGSSPLTITAYFNGRMEDASSVSLGTTSGGREVFRVTSDGKGKLARTMAIRLEGDASAETVINKLIINHYLAARQAKTYDTIPFDAGTAKVKLIREMFVDLDNPAAATLALYTDQPGFAMAERDTGVFGISSERRGERKVFSSDYYGHLMRMIIQGEDIRVHGARALLQVVGTYLFGSRGEFWSSDQIDFGSERIKMIKEIEAVYYGAGSITVESDLPGGQLVTRTVRTLTSATLEETRKLRMTGYLLGRLWRFRVAPSGGDMRLEAVRVYMKIMGEHGATSWQWVNLPVEASQDAQWHELEFGKDQAA